MCGLIGFVSYSATKKFGSHYNDKRAFIEQGLYVSALRGRDGTGLACVYEPDQPADIYKRAVCSRDFLSLKETDRMLYFVDRAIAVMGHTRSLTRGVVDDENTHPFQFDHITLMHNGTIDNHKALAKNCDVEVDSAYIAAGMAEAKTDLEVLEKVRGAYSLIWHNARDKTFNFARNEERPMFWINVPDWKGIVYGSELELVSAVLRRNGIKVEGGFKYPLKHVLYTMDLTADKLEMVTTPFEPRPSRSHGPPTEPKGTAYTSPNSIKGGTAYTTATPVNGSGYPDNTDIQTTRPELELWAQEKADQKNFHLKNSGRPTSRKGVRKAKQELAKIGLTYDATYGANVLLFQAYKNQRELGAVIMRMMGMKTSHLRAEMHNIKKPMYDLMLEDGQVLGKAVGVRHYKKEKEPTVIIELDDGYMKLVSPPPSSPKTDNYEGPFRGPGGQLFTKMAWLELVSEGCVACDGNCNYRHSEKMLWVGPHQDKPICHECAADESTLRSMGFMI